MMNEKYRNGSNEIYTDLPPLGPETLDLIRDSASRHPLALQPIVNQLADRFWHHLVGTFRPHQALDFNALSGNAKWMPEYTIDNSGVEYMSEMDALRCLVDVNRTHAFSKGIKETVEHWRKSYDGPLSAIDAGSGSGILSIFLAAHGVEDVTAIELNERAVVASRALIRDLGLRDKVGVIQGDATSISLPFQDNSAHIFVSETLSSGLTDEPYGKILDNLSPYLVPDASIIPCGAKLYVGLAGADWSGIEGDVYRAAWLKNSKHNNPSPTGYERISGQSLCANVLFTPETALRPISGEVWLHRYPDKKSSEVNTLILETSFAINSLGRRSFIIDRQASFLGNATAFRVKGHDQKSEHVQVSLDYIPGCKKRDLKALFVDGDKVIITDR